MREGNALGIEKYEQYGEAKKSIRGMLEGLGGRPDSDVTFENDDKLGFRKYGDMLLEIIRQSDGQVRSNDNESYVIGLDASWGSGKTMFLSMLYSVMDRDLDGANANLLPIYYNAWKGDFWNNAFEPFFDCIWNSILGWRDAVNLDDLAKKWNIPLTKRGEVSAEISAQRDAESVERIAIKGIGAVGHLIAAVLVAQCKSVVGLDLSVLKDDYEAVRDEIIRKGVCTEDFFPKYAEFRDAIKALREFLVDLTNVGAQVDGDLANVGLASNGDSAKDGHASTGGYTVVLLVDELDRCRPDFAVQTLEIIKHLFNVRRLVFVIALDVNQLSKTVKNVYGDGFDSVGYLERFFNLLTMLPAGKQMNYERILEAVQDEIIRCEEAGQKMGRGGVEGIGKIAERVETCTQNGGEGDVGESESQRTDDASYKWDSVKEKYAFIARSFNLSLREYRRVLLNMHMLERIVLKEYLAYDMARVMYFYCLVMKYKHPLEFSEAVFRHSGKGLVECLPHPLYGSEFEVIRNALVSGASGAIKNIDYEEYIYNENDKMWVRFRENKRLTYTEAGALRRSGDGNQTCFSFVLYYPDLLRYESISEMTLLEYVYQQLEGLDLDVEGHIH